MARKDFDNYYNKICLQYRELQNVLADISKEVSEGMIEPERLEQVKQTILPVENNYKTLGYIKYLLDKPSRRSKHKKYDKVNSKLVSSCSGRTQSDLIGENDNIINNLKV